MSEVTSADFAKLQSTVAELVRSINILILLEERQNNQMKKIGELEQRMAADEAVTKAMDKEISRWVNRGIGIWIAVFLLWSVGNSKMISDFFTK